MTDQEPYFIPMDAIRTNPSSSWVNQEYSYTIDMLAYPWYQRLAYRLRLHWLVRLCRRIKNRNRPRDAGFRINYIDLSGFRMRGDE